MFKGEKTVKTETKRKVN